MWNESNYLFIDFSSKEFKTLHFKSSNTYFLSSNIYQVLQKNMWPGRRYRKAAQKERRLEELEHVSNVRWCILVIHLFLPSFKHLLGTYDKSRSVLDVKNVKITSGPEAHQTEGRHTYKVRMTIYSKYSNRRMNEVLLGVWGKEPWLEGIWKGFNETAAFQ